LKQKVVITAKIIPIIAVVKPISDIDIS